MQDLLDAGLLKRTGVEGQVVPVESFQEHQELKDLKALELQSQH